jgi:hypothetical protein
MSVNTSKLKGSLEKRVEKLGNIAVEIVNMLATRKVDGETINVADVYFILSRALQHVSFLNLAEIEEHKQMISTKKMIV